MSGIKVHVHFTFITPGQEWLWIEAFKAPIACVDQHQLSPGNAILKQSQIMRIKRIDYQRQIIIVLVFRKNLSQVQLNNMYSYL